MKTGCAQAAPLDPVDSMYNYVSISHKIDPEDWAPTAHSRPAAGPSFA